MNYLPQLLFWAGIAQLVLALGSVAIPFVLKWKEEMKRVKPLTRTVFYTYSVYIFSVNIWFGIVGVALPQALCDGSSLAVAITVFTALYWLGRVMIQFAFGKAEGRPAGMIFLLGEIGLWGLFIALTCIYTAAALFNLGVIS